MSTTRLFWACVGVFGVVFAAELALALSNPCAHFTTAMSTTVENGVTVERTARRCQEHR